MGMDYEGTRWCDYTGLLQFHYTLIFKSSRVLIRGRLRSNNSTRLEAPKRKGLKEIIWDGFRWMNEYKRDDWQGWTRRKRYWGEKLEMSTRSGNVLGSRCLNLCLTVVTPCMTEGFKEKVFSQNQYCIKVFVCLSSALMVQISVITRKNRICYQLSVVIISKIDILLLRFNCELLDIILTYGKALSAMYTDY